MNIRFTIAKKIGLGFGIIILFVTIAFWLTNKTLDESRNKTDQVTDNHNPSVTSLKELNVLLIRSKFYITKWFYVQKGDDDIDKKALRFLIKNEYPLSKAEINKYALKWGKDEQESIHFIFGLIDEMFKSYEDDIMLTINSFDAYNDPSIHLIALMPFEENENKFTIIHEKLSSLIDQQNSNALTNTNEMLSSFGTLQNIVLLLLFILPLGAIVIAFYTVRTIVKPIYKLKKILLMMGKGVLPQEKIEDRNDEIGEMAIALNDLVEGMSRTTEFANQVGAGNFDSHYRPLSKEDTLGAALLKMRVDLQENERVLEAKVIERTEEVVQQKIEIENQSKKLEILYEHVTDSIRYAKRIQEAILPPENIVKRVLPNSFIFYKPKDIVSGDFYWVEEKNGKTMFAAVDCTGHGVPGAFMSIVAYNILKHISNSDDTTVPSQILNKLNLGVADTLHHGHDESQPDGMDLAFCTIDYKSLELQYAGAYNNLYLIRNGELIIYKADKFPIGYFMGGEKNQFTNHKIQLQKGDMLYIFSDGYADQFGGPKGKKFMANNFRDLLMKINTESIVKQKELLHKTIEDWKGSLDQVDDMLVLGLKIPD